MSTLVPQFDLTKVKDPDQFMRFASIVTGQIVSTVNGGLDFSNLNTQQVDVTFPASANSNLAITHGLGKTGVNYIVTSIDAACSIYRGTGDTVEQVFLKCDHAGVKATLILY